MLPGRLIAKSNYIHFVRPKDIKYLVGIIGKVLGGDEANIMKALNGGQGFIAMVKSMLAKGSSSSTLNKRSFFSQTNMPMPLLIDCILLKRLL